MSEKTRDDTAELLAIYRMVKNDYPSRDDWFWTNITAIRATNLASFRNIYQPDYVAEKLKGYV